MHSPPPEMKALCRAGASTDGKCSCLGFLDNVGSVGRGSPQRTLWRLLTSLFQRSHCPSAMAWLRSLIIDASRAIESRVSHWGDSDLLSCKELARDGNTAGKRKRYDQHVRELITDRPDGNGTEVSRVMNIAARQTVQEWEECAVVEHRCAALELSNLPAKTGSVACTFDAACVGRPAKDLLFHVLWIYDHGVSVVCPPRVPGLLNSNVGVSILSRLFDTTNRV